MSRWRELRFFPPVFGWYTTFEDYVTKPVAALGVLLVVSLLNNVQNPERRDGLRDASFSVGATHQICTWSESGRHMGWPSFTPKAS